MNLPHGQLASALRRTLWAGAVLILTFCLALAVCGILALVGDQLGRAAAMVIALMALFGLLLALCTAVGLLSLATIRNLEASDLEPDEPLDEIER